MSSVSEAMPRHGTPPRLEEFLTIALLPTVAGLVLALVGPLVLAHLGKTSREPALRAELLGQATLVALTAAVLAILFHWEGLPLAAIGLHTPSRSTLVAGLGLAAFFIFVFGPLSSRALGHLGLSGFEDGLSRLAQRPRWLLVLAVVVGGTAEEVLYRGYAVERLAALSGSLWTASLVSILAFGLAHVPTWGWGAALTTFVSGAVLTAFYVWQRDLGANILAHVTTDFVGIVLASNRNSSR